MHFSSQLALLLSAATFTFFTSAQAQSTTTTAATASVTLINFAALPSCAANCGPLFDAQGSCTPPGSAVSNLHTYDVCFCQYSTLQPFFTESDTVCPDACEADTDSSQELVEIQGWFTSFCASVTATATSSSATATSTKSSSGSSSESAGQTWWHSHWKWVVMLIVLFVGISTVWIGAFLLRRHIHRKRELEHEMRPPVALGPHQMQSMTGGLGMVDPGRNGGGQAARGDKVNINPAVAQVYGGGGGDGLGFGGANEKGKKEKRKWIVKDRT